MPSSHPRYIDTLILFLLVLLPLALFSPVLWHEFVNLDDPHIVFANSMIQSGVTVSALRQAFTTFYASSWVPLTWVSLMLDVQFFGTGPMGHHLVNLLLHTGSSVLLFLTFRRATKEPLPSAAVAFLFALHPMHVQSVAWAAERKDVLSAFLAFASLYAYVWYGEGRSVARYLTVWFLFLLAVLAKPMIVTLPVLLLLLDWWPLARIPSSVGMKAAVPVAWRFVAEKVPLLIAAAGVGVVTVLSQKVTGGIVTEHPLLEKCFRAAISYVEYIGKLFWPVDLSVFYPFVETYPGALSIVTSLVILLGVSTVALLLRRPAPYLLTGWAWYLVSLLPVIGLVQVGDHAIADHYSYISYIGLSVMLAWGARDVIAGRRIGPKAVWLGGALLLVTLSVVTSLQLRHWRNSFTLLSHAVAVTDNNWLALNNLGQAYLDAGRVDEAFWYFRESVRAKPSYVIALVNLGAMLALKNQPEEAAEVLRQALQYEPDNEKAMLVLQSLLSAGTPSARAR